jgi:hypothetical protein
MNATTPRRPEIDERTMKLIVGVIAIAMPVLTQALAFGELESISASYYEDGPSRVIFIGFLFAIAAFLLAYNGFWNSEMICSKVAALAALCVALFPCTCGHVVQIPYVHYIAAGAMFAILVFFCYCFYKRALAKGHVQARARAGIYATCAAVMVIAMVVLALHAVGFVHGSPRIVFWGECACLVAFGVSWLTSSKTVPAITAPQERFSPFRAVNPPPN